MRTATQHGGSIQVSAGVVALLAFVTYGAAQQPVAFRPTGLGLARWGAIVSIQGSRATAAVLQVRAVGTTWTRAKAKAASAGPAYQQVQFQIPAGLPQQPLPGQTVFLSGDGRTAGFVEFPIIVPPADECLGRGMAQGCFIMRTTDMRVSNTGIISAKTQIQSDDAIQGFTGNVAVRLQDEHGNDVSPVLYVGCWGVNLRSGRTEPWSLTAPQDAVLKTTRVILYQYTSDCGDHATAFFDQLGKAADAAGKIVQVIAAVAKL